MTDTIKKQVKSFRRKYNMRDVNVDSLKNTLSKQGYTVVEFNSIINDENVSSLIDSLKLDDYIRNSKGFTYADANYRLVFVNEDLNDEEKTLILAHEEGHIFCKHFRNQNVIGNDVMQENEANEFSFFLRNPSLGEKIYTNFKKHRVAIVSICLALIIAVIGVASYYSISKEQSYYGEYYITSTGSKYHTKNCVFVKNKTNIQRLTEEAFESGDYEPCEMCHPLD